MRTRSAAETTVEWVPHWSQRGLCKDDPEAFDLDLIGGDQQAMLDALATCRRCPVLASCVKETKALKPSERPQQLVQAGRAWTSSTEIKGRITGTCAHGVRRDVAVCPYCDKDRRRRQGKAQRDREERAA